MDSIADGVFTVDHSWNITFFNRAAEEVTGISALEALGRPCWEVFRANVCETACVLRQTLETGKPVVCQPIAILRADGKEIPITVSTALLKDEEGRIIGGVETFRDLSLVEDLRREIHRQYRLDDIISKSPLMQKIFAILPDIARSDSTVLIQGESGTGKELIARALHHLSSRARGPFVAVNCGALPDTLLESELFGHVKGAFTGAVGAKVGRFELARGGSLFLDEIGDIPVSIQTKLLRALQEQEIKPLGAAKASKVDVRILASTNQNIEEKIQDKTFREDLYYRLNVVTIKTPSLQDISEDIPLLANHFSRMACSELGLSPKRFTAEALEELRRRPWPGNVRELQNLVRRVVMFSPHSVIRSLELQALEGPGNPAAPALHPWGEGSLSQIELYGQAKERIVSRFTHDYVADLLAQTGGNVTRAAELSGLGRASLQKIMRRLGIKSEGFRKEE